MACWQLKWLALTLITTGEEEQTVGSSLMAKHNLNLPQVQFSLESSHTLEHPATVRNPISYIELLRAVITCTIITIHEWVANELKRNYSSQICVLKQVWI